MSFSIGSLATDAAVAEPIVTNASSNGTDDAKNQMNINLIALGKLKWKGNKAGKLLKATVSAHKKHGIEFGATNVEQIEFAKKVWNEADAASRTFLKTSANNFMTLAKNVRMTPIIQEALDEFQNSVTTGTGKAADYQEIVQRYTMLKAKEAAESPFTEQLTANEARFLAKFEENAANRKNVETHKPNENAVTYVYLLGLVIDIINNVPLEKSAETSSLLKDVLKFVEINGNKTTKTFNAVINKWPNIEGPTSKVNIKPHLLKLIQHKDFITATGASDDNKYLANNKLSLKRLYRMCHIFTNAVTPWAVLAQVGDEFVNNIVALHSAEKAVNSPDMMSLSIVWYLCINRANMSCVMVDHHELAANNVLAKILGVTPQSELTCAPHAFDFTADVTQPMA